jgi:hypothetical protein
MFSVSAVRHIGLMELLNAVRHIGLMELLSTCPIFTSFFCCFCDENKLCTYGSAANNGPVYRPRDDTWINVIVGMILIRETEEPWGNPVPLPLCPPQIPCGLTWTSAARGQRLMARLSCYAVILNNMDRRGSVVFYIRPTSWAFALRDSTELWILPLTRLDSNCVLLKHEIKFENPTSP